ncbi:MAG: aldehyde dehydrogenase family protein [Bacteroidota bacterium]
MPIQTRNPYNQEILATYDYLSDSELSQHLELAHDTFHHWRRTSFEAKAPFLESLISLLDERTEQYAQLMTLEMGKPLREARGELKKCMWLCRHYLEEGANMLEPLPLVFSDKQAEIQYQPTGAVLGIMPWNYPFWQVFRYIIPNIMAGNVALLKHAPNTTGCGVAIEQLCEDAGFPKGVFQTLVIDIPQVEEVIAHPIVQGVCLTGSGRAGSAVAALAGKYLKKSVLELGGTDAFAILEDADLEKALDTAFTSRMSNAGQTCIAAKRIYVPATHLDAASSYLQSKVERLSLGDPMVEGTDMGPISKGEFIPDLAQQVAKGVAHGATVITGLNAEPPFFTPGLLVAPHENPVNHEEVFGPVLSLIPYADEEKLIGYLNDSAYGLGAAVWTNDASKAEAFSAAIEAGTVVINGMVTSDPRIPFGGTKQSGYGREMGVPGMHAFLNEKVVVKG